MTKQFLQNIEARAEKLDVKLSAVMSEAGVNWSTWWRWSQGDTSPTMKKLMDINAVLDRMEKAKTKAA